MPTPRQASAPIGEVCLVGAGPGDPELLTLRALRRLQRAEVVVFDRLIHPDLLDLAPVQAERVFVGKMRDRHVMAQDAIGRLLVEHAQGGRRVVRLKGGDPFVFGRGGEEMQALAAAGIPFEIVPGVTAATGCAATSALPLTHRDHAQTLILVTGHTQNGEPELDWPTLARPKQTVVIYMGLVTLAAICAQLIAHGRAAHIPAAVIENGTYAHQRVVSGCLHDLPAKVAAAGLRGPAIIVIGEVVALQGELHGYLRRFATETPERAVDLQTFAT